LSEHRGSAYDLFLTRALQSATLVRADEPTEAFEDEHLDAVAGVRQPLTDYVLRTGTRMLEPAFMQIRQAVGIPRRCSDEAVAAVAQFVEELKSCGFIKEELRRSAQDATVAPPSRR
jgi:polar amino acid transport system substrate-binding protein